MIETINVLSLFKFIILSSNFFFISKYSFFCFQSDVHIFADCQKMMSDNVSMTG